jgi:hypothetical protein
MRSVRLRQLAIIGLCSALILGEGSCTSRDFEQIQRAAQASEDAVRDANTLSLPPGYIQGYGVTLRKDYTVVVNGGAANVQGKQVKLEDAHQLTLDDWVVPRMDTPQHYYIYLALDGHIYVDIVTPKFNDFYGYYEQADYGWRVLGKIFTYGNNIIYAIKDVERSGRTVTVAPKDYIGYADYYCDGVSDEILINAAIQYEWIAYQGGTVRLLEGTFNLVTSNNDGQYPTAISLKANITLEGIGNGTVLTTYFSIATGYSSVIAAQGTASIPMINNVIRNMRITSHTGTVTGAIGILTYLTSASSISGITINASVTYGIIALGTSDYTNITDNIIDLSSLSLASIQVIYTSGAGCKVSGNKILNVTSTNILDGIYVATAGTIVSNNTISTLSSGNGGFTCTGIRLASNYGIVSANRIEAVKNTGTATSVGGIRTNAGATSNSLTGNYCYNNGSDAGIANTNSNNFSDAGTDTQTYSNSWQSPVSGEPSLGTPHPTSDANRTSTLVVDTSTNTAGTWSAAVTMTGAPVGAKTAICMCEIDKSASAPGLSVEAATGYTLSDITSGNNFYKYNGIRVSASTGGLAYGVVRIHLDANRQFKWCTTLSSSTVKIGSAIDYET